MELMAVAHAVRDVDSDEVYDGSRAYLVRVPFAPGQLDAEITKAMNWKTQAGLIVEGDPSAASAENPCRVWVTRGEADEKTVIATIKAHKADAGWVAEKYDVEALKAKAKAGQTLTPRESTVLIAHLLDR